MPFIAIWPICEWSTCEWSIGIACAVAGAAPCSIGMVMPAIGASAAFGLATAFFAGVFVTAAVFFFGAAFFLTAGFFAAGFAGIGMVMPGMCMCCVAAGAASWASASALAPISSFDFTTM